MPPRPAFAYSVATADSASVRLTAAETVIGAACGTPWGARSIARPNAHRLVRTHKSLIRHAALSLVACLCCLRLREAPKQDHGPGLHVDVLAGGELPPLLVDVQPVGDLTRVDRNRPLLAPLRLRQHELDRLGVGVEHHVEAVVHDTAAVLVR